ncbi:MAG: hypothetical protein KGS47_09040 [Chloroflexi bacterium]|nr:hypothetical protein [Chloroflexota bacterium]
MNLQLAAWRRAPRLLFVALVSAWCCGACATPPVAADPTVTPVAEADPALRRVPTATPAAPLPDPTVVDLTQLPEVLAARQYLEAGNFAAAVELLTRVYQAHRDDPVAAELLAEAHLAWGRSWLAASQGAPAAVDAARAEFERGLALDPPPGAVRTDLATQQGLAASFVAAAADLDAIDAGGLTLDEQVARSGAALTAAQSITATDSAYPGAAWLNARALTAGGETLLRSVSEQPGADDAERVVAAQQSCTLARELVPGLERAAACLEQVARLTATPTAVPAAAGKLVVQRINQDDDPTCVSLRVVGVSTTGWTLAFDGSGLRGTFDGAGNVRVCGLASRQEGTMRILGRSGAAVSGGIFPVRGGDIFVATWQR